MPNKEKIINRPYLLVSPSLKYKDLIVTPGRRVNLIDDMYIEYTTVAVQLTYEEGQSDVTKWKVSITGSNEKPLVKLPTIHEIQTNPKKVHKELKMFGGLELSKYSRNISVDINKFGGCGLDYNSIQGWDSRCHTHEPPLLLQDVMPWFTGFEGMYSADSGVHSPKYYRNSKIILYDDLLRRDCLDMESRMSQISGVDFFDCRGNRPQRIVAPCFFYHALPDYASEYNICVDSVLKRMKQKIGGKRLQIINPHYDQVHGHLTELNKLSIKDGKLLKAEAKQYLSPKVYWIPADKLETLDSTALRLCVNMQSVSI